MSPADKKKLAKQIQQAGYGKCIDNERYIEGTMAVGEVHKLKKIRFDDDIVGVAFVSADNGKYHYIEDFRPASEKEYVMFKLQ